MSLSTLFPAYFGNLASEACDAEHGIMRQLWESRLVRIGAVGLTIGSGPLLLAMWIGHLRGDAYPTPVGPGILAMVTFWPSVICLAVGLSRVLRK